MVCWDEKLFRAEEKPDLYVTLKTTFAGAGTIVKTREARGLYSGKRGIRRATSWQA